MIQSTNPFMITSNQDYGIKIEKLKNCPLVKAFESSKGAKTINEHNESKLAFLYTRESDRIGAEVQNDKSALAKAFDKDNFQRRKQLTELDETGTSRTRNTVVSAEEVKATLDIYNHAPKLENPLYTTTSNEFGSKKPSQATFNKVRYSRSQNFSKSFNRIMFQDQGLNTSLTRSNVHDRLDSQFV